MAGRVQSPRPVFPVNRQIQQISSWIFVQFAGLTFPELGCIITIEREERKMTIFELEKKIEDMRIKYVKEHWCGNIDNLNHEDLISIYAMLVIKNKEKERLKDD